LVRLGPGKPALQHPDGYIEEPHLFYRVRAPVRKRRLSQEAPMAWNTDPDKLHGYQQTGGYCYGICRLLVEAVGYSVYRKSSTDVVYDAMVKQLKTSASQGAKGAQDKRRQSGRRYASKFWSLADDNCYIVGCNISLQPGSLGRYAIASYFDKAAWAADHAVLFVGSFGNTIVCDPNWGCGLWNGLSIGSLSWADINQLIEGGYRRVRPVYATEIELP
jgi:hypothetical protein